MGVVFIVGFVITLIGTILHLIGMATTAWSTYTYTVLSNTYDAESGLFRYCNDGNCDDIEPDDQGDYEDSIRAIQAMVIIGIILAIVSLIVAIVHIAFGCMKKQPIKAIPLVAGVLAIVAAIFVLIGIAIWGGEIQDDLLDPIDPDVGWSAILSIIGMILLLIGGIVKLAGAMTSSVGTY